MQLIADLASALAEAQFRAARVAHTLAVERGTAEAPRYMLAGCPRVERAERHLARVGATSPLRAARAAELRAMEDAFLLWVASFPATYALPPIVAGALNRIAARAASALTAAREAWEPYRLMAPEELRRADWGIFRRDFTFPRGETPPRCDLPRRWGRLVRARLEAILASFARGEEMPPEIVLSAAPDEVVVCGTYSALAHVCQRCGVDWRE